MAVNSYTPLPTGPLWIHQVSDQTTGWFNKDRGLNGLKASQYGTIQALDSGISGHTYALFTGVPTDADTLEIYDELYEYDTGSPNLFHFSEVFDNAYWTKTASTIGANTSDTTDPFGTNLADKVTTTNATQSILRAVARTANLDYAFSVWVKKSTANKFFWMKMDDGTNSFTVWLDLESGLVSNDVATNGFVLISTPVNTYAEGWYRLSIVATTPAGTTGNWSFGISNTNDTYTCTSGDIYYAFGADLRQSSTALPYESNRDGTGGGAVTTGIRIDGTTLSTAAQAALALATAINRNAASRLHGTVIGDGAILAQKLPTGDVFDLTNGLTNSTVTTIADGTRPALRRQQVQVRVPSAEEVTNDFMSFLFPFTVRAIDFSVVVTATNEPKGYDGGYQIDVDALTGLNVVSLINGGTAPVDFAATDTVTMIAYE